MTLATRPTRLLAGLVAALGAAVGIGVIPGATIAQESLTRLSNEAAENFVAQPLTNTVSRTPLVMLGLAIDEKAYRRAYDDLADLDGDGVIDSTYKDAVEYSGYFDPALCYAYADDRFRASAAADGHRCTSAASDWSGNFLNWLTMTRIDLIRHALYGGRRSTDDAALTILERAHVPEDNHAWVKLYGGSDLADFAPLTQPASGITSFCNVSREGGTDVLSQNSTSAPLLRVAPGAFPLWSAIERAQCDGDNGNPRPGTPGGGSNPITDLVVRIEACSADAPVQEANCRPYPSGSAKPAGVLQKYGEDGVVRFGLMARSYSRPRSGGQLRRTIGPIARNGNDPAQCAAGDEIRLSTGQFCTPLGADGGIVGAVDRMRIASYLFTQRNGGVTPSHTDCNRDDLYTRGDNGNSILSPGPAGGQPCNSYGNPVAEIMGEALRYIAGAADPSDAYVTTAAGEQALIPGLPVPGWDDPLAALGECADCSLVMISNGAISFDGDELPTLPLRGAAGGEITAADLTAGTDTVGSAEGLNQRLFAGRIETTPPTATTRRPDGALCAATDAAVTALSTVRGACAAAPARDGSYHAAGVAYLGNTRDLRPDLSGRQSARLYALEFDDSVPSITVPTASGALTITPSCQSLIGNPDDDDLLDDDNRRRHCTFASALPGPLTATDSTLYGRGISATGRSGSLYVAWDEAPYGGTQENTAAQLITWCVGDECQPQGPAGSRSNLCFQTTASSSPNCVGGALRTVGADELMVRVEQLSGFISAPVLLGYSISGAADADRNATYNTLTRPRVFSDVEARNLILAPANPLPASWRRAEVQSFTAGDSGVRKLPSPLLLAAKFGGFEVDPDAATPLPEAATTDGAGCTATSWDAVDNATGLAAPDCIPDHYHGLRHPGAIASRMERVIRDVIASTGGAQSLQVGVQSGLALTPGAAYQTFYESEAVDTAGRRARWIGNVQGLFVDRDGNFREDDASRDGLLDEADYSGHPVVQLFFDGITRQTRFRRYSANPADDPDAFEVVDDYRQLRTIWNARRQLASLDDVVTQRAYDSSAASGRHIFSFADLNLDGKADDGEAVAFTAANFATGRSGVLNVGSAAQAATLIDWTRGQDAPGLRSRQLDRDGNGVQTQRLGDIVNSEPLVVGAPGEAYDLLYGDPSYATFFGQYRNRRQMVYVGANDGLLHAFNAGFRVAGNGGFALAPDGGSAVEHPLGSEVWAYVPFNLLPHLGFLASPNYVHQWTMDGSPRAFDVRAFAADSTHPGGWGTILVVGMRLGGAPVTIPGVASGGPNRAGFGDFAAGLGAASEFVSRSAYVVLDVTDPEQPPKLIAEFTDPSGALGMTTSRPAVVPFVTPASGGTPRSDNWYLVFGNGPDDHDPATSSRSARLYALDLGTLLSPSATPADALRAFAADGVSAGSPVFAAASFVGDPVAVDWDLNYRADALYFGTAGGTPAAPAGRLFKLDFNPTQTLGAESADPVAWSAPAVLLDPERPVLAAPSVTQDERGNRWVLAGSGRLLSAADRGSVARQTLFGVIDRLPVGAAPLLGSLTETTAAVVARDGTVTGLAGIATETELRDAIRGATATPGATGTGGWRYQLAEGSGNDGAERNLSRTALLDSILFATSYTPSEALCADDGSSRLFGVNFLTGAARARLPALNRTVVIGGVDLIEPLNVIDLGRGLAGTPTFTVSGGPGTGRGTYRINIQTTTGAIQQRLADDSGRIRSSEIDWRETHPRLSP